MQTSPDIPKPRRGCLFYGCLTGTVCFLAILLALLLGLHQFRRMVSSYTDTKPSELPTVQISPERFTQLERRIENFQDAVRTGRSTPPLALTADEINALIEKDPKLSSVNGKVYVVIQDDHLQGDLSVPLEQLGLRIFRGRYLNGTAAFAISLRDGILNVSAQSIRVKGQPLPGVYMDRIRMENLAERMNEDVRASVALNRLQDIQVKDGKLILVPKVEK